jgi:hypothetical protein
LTNAAFTLTRHLPRSYRAGSPTLAPGGSGLRVPGSWGACVTDRHLIAYVILATMVAIGVAAFVRSRRRPRRTHERIDITRGDSD